MEHNACQGGAMELPPTSFVFVLEAVPAWSAGEPVAGQVAMTLSVAPPSSILFPPEGARLAFSSADFPGHTWPSIDGIPREFTKP